MRQFGWCVPCLCACLVACGGSTPTAPSPVTAPAPAPTPTLAVSGSLFTVGERPAGPVTIHAPGAPPASVLASGQFTLQAPMDLASLVVRFDGREVIVSLPMSAPSGPYVTVDLRLDTATARAVVTRFCTSSGPPTTIPGVSVTLCVSG